MSETGYTYQPIPPDELKPGMEVLVDWDGVMEKYTLVEMSHPDEDTWWCRGVDEAVAYHLFFEEYFFRRVEMPPEPSKRRQFWVDPMSRLYRDSKPQHHPEKWVYALEVMPPEIKELPDQMGVWTRMGTTWAVNISQRFDDGKLGTSEGSDPQWIGVDRLPKGRWLFVTPLIQQAWEDSK